MPPPFITHRVWYGDREYIRGEAPAEGISMARYILDACVNHRERLPFVITVEELREANSAIGALLKN